MGSFSDRLRALMDERGLSEEQIAVAMGRGSGGTFAVRRLLDGKPSSPRMDEGLRLCERYGLDPFDFCLGRPRSAPLGSTVTHLPASGDETESLGRSADQPTSFVASLKKIVKRIEALERAQGHQGEGRAGPGADTTG